MKERDTEQMYLVNLAEKTKHFLGKSEMCHFSGVKREDTVEPGSPGNRTLAATFFLEVTWRELTSDASHLATQGPV